MKIATTKALTNILNKNSKYQITLEKLTIEQFKILVDFDVWEHETDFDFAINKFKVIKIKYNNLDHACDNYITTKDLTKILHDLKEKTLDAFINAFNEFVEI